MALRSVDATAMSSLPSPQTDKAPLIDPQVAHATEFAQGSACTAGGIPVPVRRALVVGACALGFATVASLMEPLGAAASTKVDEPARPLGELVGRNHRLKVNMGPLGPTYTLTSRDGSVVDSDSDLNALSQRHPGLHLNGGVAEEQAGARLLMMAEDREEF